MVLTQKKHRRIFLVIQTDDWEIKHRKQFVESRDGGNRQLSAMQMDLGGLNESLGKYVQTQCQR